jgi:glycosyltransferase involved in cell wall biosynthesis
MEKRKRLLMIAYFFPPLGGSGALRPVKLAKYLPDFGWEPIILTVKNPDWYYAYDRDLLRELPPDLPVLRTPMLRSAFVYRLLNPFRIRSMDQALRRFLLQPDDQVGWIPFGYLSGLQTAERSAVKAIYSTSAPMSTHLIAYLLHKRTGLPWVADFRDEWFENPDFSFPTCLHRSFHYHLEGMVVKKAHRVIAPAEEFLRLLEKHTDGGHKFHTIEMGFDPDDFSTSWGTERAKGRRFVLTFSGLFYGSFKPFMVLKAINDLIEKGKIPAGDIKVRFVGANTPEESGFEDRYKICEFTGFVSHKQALAYITGSDAALLLLSKERGKDVIPSKTFEYMASGNPILAVVPSDGEVARIIRKTNTGVVADFEDTEGIKAAYLRLYRQWVDKSEGLQPDTSEIAKYDQRRLAKRFASLLDEIRRT